MYCVKCGVRLQEGAKTCPLCDTPVRYDGDTGVFSGTYPGEIPARPSRAGRLALVGFLTLVLAAAGSSCLIFCLNTYGKMAWSGYVIFGILAAYAIGILPLWFRKPHPMIFVPVSFCAACGYLLYISIATGGNWFWRFAFPTVMLAGALTTATVALYRYIKKGRLFITGGLLIAIGGSAMLIELFQHLTFGSRMFVWSLYPVTAFGVFGLFLILAGMIRPLRRALERTFFI